MLHIKMKNKIYTICFVILACSSQGFCQDEIDSIADSALNKYCNNDARGCFELIERNLDLVRNTDYYIDFRLIQAYALYDLSNYFGAKTICNEILSLQEDTVDSWLLNRKLKGWHYYAYKCSAEPVFRVYSRSCHYKASILLSKIFLQNKEFDKALQAINLTDSTYRIINADNCHGCYELERGHRMILKSKIYLSLQEVEKSIAVLAPFIFKDLRGMNLPIEPQFIEIYKTEFSLDTLELDLKNFSNSLIIERHYVRTYHDNSTMPINYKEDGEPIYLSLRDITYHESGRKVYGTYRGQKILVYTHNDYKDFVDNNGPIHRNIYKKLEKWIPKSNKEILAIVRAKINSSRIYTYIEK